jgi:hypothetical protein
MLIVGFVVVVLIPTCLWLVGTLPPGKGNRNGGVIVFVLLSWMFAGPLAILLVLDRISRRVVADLPGKFGPKVPTVGKWNASPRVLSAFNWSVGVPASAGLEARIPPERRDSNPSNPD